MNWNLLITILSLIGGILAWVAKILWSSEYSKAKDETIKAKEAQIELLNSTIQKYKDFSPEVVYRLYETTKKASENFISVSDQELKAAQEKIEELKIEDQKKKHQLTLTNNEVDSLKKEVDNLAKELIIIKNNPLSVQPNNISSASGSSIAISNLLSRGTVNHIVEVTNTYLPLFPGDQFNENFSPPMVKVEIKE